MLPRKTLVVAVKRLRCFSNSASTIDKQEIDHFQKLITDWWDELGNSKALHSMNALRVPFVRDGLINTGNVGPENVNTSKPLKGITLLDVGCGGGILSEPLAKLGAEVTGIDGNEDMIKLAEKHAKLSDLNINYCNTCIEEHLKENREKYDAVVASEVVEHVTQKSEFIEACVKCLKPSGSIFVTTINKTWSANFFGIFVAENLLKLVPRGTHQFEKFLEPHKLQKMLEDNGCVTHLTHGMFYNFMTNTWNWTTNKSICYALHAVKLKM